MAVSTVKRFLVEPTAKIRLRDLIHDETEKLIGELNDKAFPGMPSLNQAEDLKQRIDKYNVLSETLLSLIVTGCYWGNQQHSKLWVDCLERLANQTGERSGTPYLLNLRRYPALLLLYGAGLAAVAAGNYQTLAAILTQPSVKDINGKEAAICTVVDPRAVMANNIAHLLPGLDRHYTPVSDYLFDRLRALLREYIPRDEDYEEKFDYFEYLLALVHADLVRQEWEGSWIGPIGRFKWRNNYTNSESLASNKIGKELETQGANWAPLKAGLFGGSIEQAKSAKARFDAFLKKVPF